MANTRPATTMTASLPGMDLYNACQSIVSITLDHVVISLVAVHRSRAVDANAQPRCLSTVPPIHTASLTFEAGDIARKPIVLKPQGGDFAGRRQCPVSNGTGNQSAHGGHDHPPEQPAHVG